MAAVTFDPSQSGATAQQQAQVSVMRQQRSMQEVQGQQAVQLINQAGQVAQNAPQQTQPAAQPSGGNPPHVGRNINIVA